MDGARGRFRCLTPSVDSDGSADGFLLIVGCLASATEPSMRCIQRSGTQCEMDVRFPRLQNPAGQETHSQILSEMKPSEIQCDPRCAVQHRCREQVFLMLRGTSLSTRNDITEEQRRTVGELDVVNIHNRAMKRGSSFVLLVLGRAPVSSL